MESSVATSMDKEAYKAATNFEAEFDFSKMKTMIHRFPAGLGEVISSRYPYMVVPRFVAIGQYHHRKTKHLEKTEAVKKAAAHYLWQRSKKLKEAVKKAAAHYRSGEKLAPDDDAATRQIVDAVNEAWGMYFADDHEETTVSVKKKQGTVKADAQFADMMICDACFLLLYMHAYVRSYGEDDGNHSHVNESMRRFLFCNRDRINNDIMLLENQLPWRVVQVLMRLGSDLKLKETVGYFIAAMGSSFKIRESSELKPYVWDDKDDPHPPAHLLALLRRHKTQDEPADKIHSACASAEPGGSSSSTSVHVLSHDDVENGNNNHQPTPSNSLHDPLIDQAAASTPPPPPPPPPSTTSSAQARNRREVVVSAISPMDLEQIGINLAGSKTEKFSDMGMEEGWLWSRLTLAPLSMSDTGASWLVNMAAFEVCTASRFGDPADRTAVCSYLKLLAFFMVGSDDVRKLRSMGLLNGPNRDDDMVAFFHTLKKHLPGYGTHFAKVMADIEEYKQKRLILTTIYRWVYNNWKTVCAVLSIIFAVVTAIAALIRLYQALLSLIHN